MPDFAEIVFNSHADDIIFTRKVQNKFEMIVKKTGFQRTITSEKEFSKYFFIFLNIRLSELSSVRPQKNGIKPYISNFLPLIWIRQSTGWTYVYQPLKAHKFIKDQQEEMVRVLLNIPPKHPFSITKSYENKKVELEGIKNRIEISKKNLEDFQKEIGNLINKNLEDIENEKKR